MRVSGGISGCRHDYQPKIVHTIATETYVSELGQELRRKLLAGLRCNLALLGEFGSDRLEGCVRSVATPNSSRVRCSPRPEISRSSSSLDDEKSMSLSTTITI